MKDWSHLKVIALLAETVWWRKMHFLKEEQKMKTADVNLRILIHGTRHYDQIVLILLKSEVCLISRTELTCQFVSSDLSVWSFTRERMQPCVWVLGNNNSCWYCFIIIVRWTWSWQGYPVLHVVLQVWLRSLVHRRPAARWGDGGNWEMGQTVRDHHTRTAGARCKKYQQSKYLQTLSSRMKLLSCCHIPCPSFHHLLDSLSMVSPPTWTRQRSSSARSRLLTRSSSWMFLSQWWLQDWKMVLTSMILMRLSRREYPPIFNIPNLLLTPFWRSGTSSVKL